MANRTEMESYESVKNWLESMDLTNGSGEATKRPYLFRFGKVCDDFKATPDELLERAKGDQSKFEREVAAWYSRKLKETSQSNIYHNWQVLNSFLKHNEVILKKKPKQPQIEDRAIPNKETLRRIMNYASVKLRAYIMVARDSGLAPVDILALKYSAIKDELEKGVVPCAIKKNRSKTGVRFHTFVGQEAIDALKTYLDTRKDAKGISLIKDDSYLFTAYLRGQKALDYHSLQDQFKRAATRAGSKAQLYDLRRFFMTNLQTDEAQEAQINLWSGHSLGVNRNYRIPDLEKSRELYAKHYPALSFSEGVVRRSDLEQKDRQIEDLQKKMADDDKRMAEMESQLAVFKDRDKEMAEMRRKIESFRQDMAGLKKLDLKLDKETLYRKYLEKVDPERVKELDRRASRKKP